MVRDLLDRDLLTLIDLASSVAHQLRRVDAARRGLRFVGQDPDALAVALDGSRGAARDAWADARNAQLSLRHAQRQMVALIPDLARWTRLCAATTDAAVLGASPDDALALRRVRRLVVTRKERFAPLHACVSALEAALNALPAHLLQQPALATCVAAARPLVADADAKAAAVEANDAARERAQHLRDAARKTLFDQLRAVVDAWRIASFATEMPELDLREAHAARRRAPPREEGPAASTPEDGAAEDGAAEDGAPGAPGSAPTEPDATACAPVGAETDPSLAPAPNDAPAVALDPNCDAVATVVVQVATGKR